MRSFLLSMCVAATCVVPVAGQADPIELPLRIEDGRILVLAEHPHGGSYEFVLGLGMNAITDVTAAELGRAASALDLGGIRVDLEGAQTVDASMLGGASGVIGGEALHRYDILIDVPGGRLLLKPAGRAVRWDGVSLSSPVSTQVFHDALMRIDTEVDGKLVGGLMDFVNPKLSVNEPLRGALDDDGETMGLFRMGYGSWSDVPARVIESPVFGAWDPDGNGFVIIGSSVAHDCVFAVSWTHTEVRTCLP